MIHGASVVRFAHAESKVEVSFSALDALVEWRRHCFERPVPKVANAKDWSEDRAETLADIPSVEYDWTFQSEYSGTLSNASLETSAVGDIPYEKLKRKEEIVMWDSLVLMEDELADNGTCIETVKVRVMPTGFFCLHRILMRLDGVVASTFDTRLYHEFGSKHLFHEFSVRSSSFAEMRASGLYPKDPSQMGDENFLYEILKKRSCVTSTIKL